MLELLSAGDQGKVGTGKFKYLDSVVGPTYTQVNEAMGFVGGSRITGDAYMSFLEEDTGEVWLVAKSQTIYNLDHNLLDAAGAFSGKVITIAGEQYFCRTVKMTTRGFTNTDLPNGGSVVYTAASTFANSEFNNIFYQVLGQNGQSVEGIEYGTSAKFSPAQLGFHAGQGGSLIGAEVNPDGYRVVQAAGYTSRLSRKAVSVSHGWRPMLRKI
ncbi:hypothetical protein [Pectobacterium phage PcCB7V]|nr:hypothetical protein [Pectobacterium phage PcCB7V]